ncbi:Kinesin, partial [Thalictrum thalictroides]
MLPRNAILRENISDTPCSPNPNSLKQKSNSSSSRKQKSSKENAPPPSPSDPNVLLDPSSASPSMATAKTPLSTGKIKNHHLPPRPPSSNQNPLKRKLNMDTSSTENSIGGSSDTGVKVIVRMRPPNKNEEEGEMIVQKVSNDSLSILGQTFTFDSVADINSSQQEIFHLVGAPLVENCLAGFNSSIFAYGQTGSGKTYTMWGPANALLEGNIANSPQGLTPRVFEQLFTRIDEEQVKHADRQLQYQCRCSFLEIYNEQITDLLDPAQRNLLIREDVKSGVYVENLTEELVCTMEDVTQILIKGFSNRKTGATSLNAESSRSHSVFTCVVESRCKSVSDGLSSIRISRINLVDLAGSERQKSTGAAGERLKEAGNINRSLSQLGNLINILAEVSQSGKQRHIPYRDSRLTFLLQESLGGNAKLAMICAISPAQSCKSETLSTLRFAQRAKTIKNKAVVNEVTQDDVNVLREVIRQLKDELLRMKENGNPSNLNGGYTTSWNARRSLNLLKMSLNRPMSLPHVDEDSDEEMEIDEDAVEMLSVQVGLQSTGRKEDIVSVDNTQQHDFRIHKPSASEESDVNMEDCQFKVISEDVEKCSKVADITGLKRSFPDDRSDLPSQVENNENQRHLTHSSVDSLTASALEEPINDNLVISCESLSRKPEVQSAEPNISESVDHGSELDRGSELAVPQNSLASSPNSVLPSELRITSTEVSPILKSPTLSVSPRVNSSRKSLKTSSMLSASQKDLAEGKNSEEDEIRLSFAHPSKSNSSKGLSSRTSKACHASTEHLAESLHRGLQIIDNLRQSSAVRRSSFRFSYRPVDVKPVMPIEKVDVAVQTLPEEYGESEEDSSGHLCDECKGKIEHNEVKEPNENPEMQLVAIDDPKSSDKLKKQVPKAVEKVLAGAIRREMALEEFCSRQTAEIMQLNRLVQQYKHERECNAILEQTREDKIIRLESLMDGVLPTEEFMEEEFLSLTNEHKLLKAKYDNHPEVLRTKIELKRVQDELDGYRNFFDMGEKDVLIEEIQHLRSQLKYYVDSNSPASTQKRSSLLQLTFSCEPSPTPLSTISESTEESVEDKFEQERRNWTEVEKNWISLAEELRVELEANRSLAEKQKQELDSEKKCSEELQEAMQMAMQGHARILEQYADLQEKHIALLARHRKMQEGIEDVKKAATKAGVKGAESRFINSLAAEISALR